MGEKLEKRKEVEEREKSEHTVMVAACSRHQLINVGGPENCCARARELYTTWRASRCVCIVRYVFIARYVCMARIVCIAQFLYIARCIMRLHCAVRVHCKCVCIPRCVCIARFETHLHCNISVATFLSFCEINLTTFV